MDWRSIFNFDLQLFLNIWNFFIKKPVKMFNYMYNNSINFVFENQSSKLCCEVFADVNAIYFTALWRIMNVWRSFETLKPNFRENAFYIIFTIKMDVTVINQRPYHVECTASRPISEVKQRWVWLVLGWVTAWEHQMLLAFFFFFFLASHMDADLQCPERSLLRSAFYEWHCWTDWVHHLYRQFGKNG